MEDLQLHPSPGRGLDAPGLSIDGVVGEIYLGGLDPPDGIYATLGGRWECVALQGGHEMGQGTGDNGTLNAVHPPTPAPHVEQTTRARLTLSPPPRKEGARRARASRLLNTTCTRRAMFDLSRRALGLCFLLPRQYSE